MNKNISIGFGKVPPHIAFGLCFLLLTLCAFFVQVASSADKLAVQNATGATLFTVQDTGKVGIGTDSPMTNLHIAGVTPAFTVSDTQSTNSSFYSNWTDYAQLSVNRNPSTGVFTDINKAGAQLSMYGGPNNSMFQFYTAGANNITPSLRMVIDKNGNVGIGTSNPTYPLQTASGAYVSAGGVWMNASSREYKEDIRDLSSAEAIETLDGLNPVKYSYKTDTDDKHVGFIAEDVPDLVATKDRKGLSPMDIVAVLTKVVQEQQKTISALSEKVADLQREIKLKGTVASSELMGTKE